MSPLSKYRALFFGFMASGMMLTLLTLYASTVFVLAFFANLFIWAWWLRRVVCPRCGDPLAPPTRTSIQKVHASFFAKSCQICGCSLTKEPPRETGHRSHRSKQ
jgi:hypothetical protein